jgi:vancomycin permeability regulator SanA
MKMPKPYDVIVVFGAAVWKGGKPSPALKRRLLHGVALLQEGHASNLLVTGGIGRYPPSEAAVMKDLAQKAGIDSENIFMEDEGTSTYSSITKCSQIMHRNNWTSVLVVSDPYHVNRAARMFRCFNIKADGSAPEGGKHSNSVWRWRFYYLREFLALPWYLILMFSTVMRKRTRHIFSYNLQNFYHIPYNEKKQRGGLYHGENRTKN